MASIRALKLIAVAVLALAVLVGGWVAWKYETLVAVLDGADVPAATADDVLEWLAAHPGHAALATWEVGDEAHGLFLDADRPLPLASVVKLVALGGFAGQLDPDEAVPLAEWERFYLPGTDGDAHPGALKALGPRADGRYTVQDVAFAMIRHSDNAAFDWLLFRLGRSSGSPHPLSGEFLACGETATHETADADAWREARALREGAPAPRLNTSLAAALRCTRERNNRGTAREYAKLMERVVSGELPGAAKMRPLLEWPMELPGTAKGYETFGTKGGSLPGLLTSAYYAQPKGAARPRVLALFLHDLPFGLYLNLRQTYAHQELEARLLSDAAFRARVQERLLGEEAR